MQSDLWSEVILRLIPINNSALIIIIVVVIKVTKSETKRKLFRWRIHILSRWLYTPNRTDDTKSAHSKPRKTHRWRYRFAYILYLHKAVYNLCRFARANSLEGHIYFWLIPGSHTHITSVRVLYCTFDIMHFNVYAYNDWSAFAIFAEISWTKIWECAQSLAAFC